MSIRKTSSKITLLFKTMTQKHNNYKQFADYLYLFLDKNQQF